MKNTRFVAFGGIAILLAGMFAIMSLHEITAQETNSTAQFPHMRAEIPQLNGSVNIVEQSNQFIRDSVQVTFATALETAQSEVGNGTAISGRLGVVQGYLVYIFKVANFDSETARIVIVDAGNGAVLHTSGDMSLYFGGLGCGGGHHHKGFGNHWGTHERGSGTLDRNNSGDQSFGGGMVASPAIGA
ncbi:MAG: hypothetical protein M3093_04490 [Thermoproteota archaeon]|nr:hypothetical protein [Thermoproteota archaeon]